MSDYLDQYISDNDKEPSWDGHVYIYGSKKHDKSNFKGRVPVQVKGKVCDDFTRSEITYKVNAVDLRSYLGDGGVVFFVVYIGNRGVRKKIYYVELTPIRLRMILNKIGNKKSKTIKLKEFPLDNNKKATVFFNCFQNCKKQSSFSEAHLFSLEELSEQGILENVVIPLSGIDIKKDPQKALLDSDVYLYASVKGSTILQPLEIIPENMHTQEESNVSVTVNGKEFYDKIRVIRSVENTKYAFGESTVLTAKDGEKGVKINYRNSDNLRVMAKDLEFMLSYIEAGQFEINGQPFPFEYDNIDYSNFNIEQQKDLLCFAHKAVQVLDALKCDKTLLVSSLEDEDCRNVLRLYTALIEKNTVKGLKENLPLICYMKVGNLNFIVVLHKIENNPNSYRVENFFGANLVAAYDGRNGEKLAMSPYCILKVEDLVKADNINWDLLLPSFKTVDKHEESFERANWFLLNLLLAYDKSGNKIILNIAKEFAEWICSASDDDLPNTVTTLNLLQVIKRGRNLNSDELNLLYRIITEKENPDYVMVGAYLLLEEQSLAEMYFSKMDKDEQDEFLGYPIYHFWKKNDNVIE